MKRIGYMFLAFILSFSLVITPVMAKGGGNSSGGGKGSSVSSSNSSGGGSSGAGKASSVSPGNSGNKGNGGGGNVSAGNNSGSEKSTNKGQGKSDSGNKSSVVKDNNKVGNNKVDSTNRGQSKKDLKVDSGKKVKDGVDLTRGNKQVIQERLQLKEAKTAKRQFKDTEGHWAQNCIQRVQQIGLIQGYEDGSFNPDAAVRRVEAMVMVVNLAEIINEDSLTDESDIDETTDETDENNGDENTVDDETTDENNEDDDSVNDEDENTGDVPAWARNQARKASMMKIININRFHSEVQASRAQVAVMLAKALELEPVEVDEKAFTDNLKISPEDVGYIIALKNAGVIKGTPDGKFNPNSAITRAEMAAMLAKVLENVEDEEEGDQPEEESEVSDEDTENDEITDPIEDDDTLTDETESDTEDTESETDEDTPDSSDNNQNTNV